MQRFSPPSYLLSAIILFWVAPAQWQGNKEATIQDVNGATPVSISNDATGMERPTAVDGEKPILRTRSTDYEQVISVKYLTLQEGVDSEEAREFMENEYLQVYSELPGFNVKVGQPDPTRIDDSAPDFVIIYIFDSKWTRDHYFPEPDVWSDEIHRAIEKNQSAFDRLFGVYFVQSKYESHEYIMFARAK